MKKTFFLFLLAIATFCIEAQTNRFNDSTVFNNVVNIRGTNKNFYYKKGAVSGYVLTATDTNGKAAWQAPSSGDTTWLLSDTNIYAANIGNVGIGTATPHSKVTIYGSFSDSAYLSYGTGAVIAAGDSIRLFGITKSGAGVTNGYSSLQLTDDRAQGKTLWHWVIGNNFAKVEGDSIEIRFKAGGKTLYYDNSGFYSINYDSLGKLSRPWIRGYIDSVYSTQVNISASDSVSIYATTPAEFTIRSCSDCSGNGITGRLLAFIASAWRRITIE